MPVGNVDNGEGAGNKQKIWPVCWSGIEKFESYRYDVFYDASG